MTSCVLLTALTYFQRVAGEESGGLAWNRSDAHYRAVEQRLIELEVAPCLAVMVNNPPGYYAASRRSSVVIPYGDETMLLEAAEKYDVSILVLEENDAGHLNRLFEKPGDYPYFDYLGEVDGTKIYALSPIP